MPDVSKQDEAQEEEEECDESHFAATSKPLSSTYVNGHILQSHPQMVKDPQVLPRDLHEGIVLCLPHNDAQLAVSGCRTKQSWQHKA